MNICCIISSYLHDIEVTRGHCLKCTGISDSQNLVLHSEIYR